MNADNTGIRLEMYLSRSKGLLVWVSLAHSSVIGRVHRRRRLTFLKRVTRDMTSAPASAMMEKFLGLPPRNNNVTTTDNDIHHWNNTRWLPWSYTHRLCNTASLHALYMLATVCYLIITQSASISLSKNLCKLHTSWHTHTDTDTDIQTCGNKALVIRDWRTYRPVAIRHLSNVTDGHTDLWQ